jgi:hypothetical protein
MHQVVFAAPTPYSLVKCRERLPLYAATLDAVAYGTSREKRRNSKQAPAMKCRILTIPIK